MSKPNEKQEKHLAEEDEEEDEEEEIEEEEKVVAVPPPQPVKVLKPTIFYEDGKPSSKFRLELFEDLRVVLIQQQQQQDEKSNQQQEIISRIGTWVSSKISSSSSAKWTSCIGIRWKDDESSTKTMMAVNVSENGLLILNNERTFITLQY